MALCLRRGTYRLQPFQPVPACRRHIRRAGAAARFPADLGFRPALVRKLARCRNGVQLRLGGLLSGDELPHALRAARPAPVRALRPLQTQCPLGPAGGLRAQHALGGPALSVHQPVDTFHLRRLRRHGLMVSRPPYGTVPLVSPFRSGGLCRHMARREGRRRHAAGVRACLFGPEPLHTLL